MYVIVVFSILLSRGKLFCDGGHLIVKQCSDSLPVFSDSLSSTLDGRYACPDEDVTYTCTGTTALSLTWLVLSYVSQGDGLRFNKHDSIGMTETKDSFTATLIHLENTSNPSWFEITMTLNFPTSHILNGTTISCGSQILMDTYLYMASKFRKFNGCKKNSIVSMQVNLHLQKTSDKL